MQGYTIMWFSSIDHIGLWVFCLKNVKNLEKKFIFEKKLWKILGLVKIRDKLCKNDFFRPLIDTCPIVVTNEESEYNKLCKFMGVKIHNKKNKLENKTFRIENKYILNKCTKIL